MRPTIAPVSVLLARAELVQSVRETRAQLRLFTGAHTARAEETLRVADHLLELVPAAVAAECDRRAAGQPPAEDVLRSSMVSSQAVLGGH